MYQYPTRNVTAAATVNLSYRRSRMYLLANIESIRSVKLTYIPMARICVAMSTHGSLANLVQHCLIPVCAHIYILSILFSRRRHRRCCCRQYNCLNIERVSVPQSLFFCTYICTYFTIFKLVPNQTHPYWVRPILELRTLYSHTIYRGTTKISIAHSIY